MSRVLLTGASGFIGRQALETLLAEGHAVHAVARTVGEPRAGVVWHAADLLRHGTASDLVASVRPERLIHLAWTTTPGRYWTSLDNVAWAAATLELHHAFAAAGGQRAVYAGTCAEYDWSSPDLDEARTPLLPKTFYGTAKASTGRLLVAAGQHGGPSVAWGRIFYLYGPGEASGRLVSDVVAGLLSGRPVDCTEGRQERDFMHVADVARAFVALLASDVAGAVNIASGDCRPVRDLVTEIGRQTGRTDLLRLGARAAPPDDPPRLSASITRLRDEVGFVPRYDRASGLADTIAWWRKRLAATTAGPA